MPLINRSGSALLLALALLSCQDRAAGPSPTLIKDLQLKRGNVISCGPADQQLGSLTFALTGDAATQKEFITGLKLLHSFEYDEAEKVFARLIDREPGCAMAYWGVAMSSFHALWSPPAAAELRKGAQALAIARSIGKKSAREAAYIEALGAFFDNWETADHKTRCLRFERAMEQLAGKFAGDREATILYALALNAAADPKEQTFSKQKKAGALLNSLYPNEPDHPGILHYLIHTYDNPALAMQALPAARRYAAVAPSSAHALHMPSHIFTRLGLWEEDIRSNLASVNSAVCYAQQTGIKGHWDEELHGRDYLAYAYLQQGNNAKAKEQWEELRRIDHVEPANFKVAYAFAAIPSRYVLENRMWKEAAALDTLKANFTWGSFPWQRSMLHFTRLLGAAHTGATGIARTEWSLLKAAQEELLRLKDPYKAEQVAIQMQAGEAWILWAEGKKEEALRLMRAAADREDGIEKHPVTPSEVLPARELLGDLLMEYKQFGPALDAYEQDLKTHPKRFNGVYGAASAAEQLGKTDKALAYYRELLSMSANSDRAERKAAEAFLRRHQAVAKR